MKLLCPNAKLDRLYLKNEETDLSSVKMFIALFILLSNLVVVDCHRKTARFNFLVNM